MIVYNYQLQQIILFFRAHVDSADAEECLNPYKNIQIGTINVRGIRTEQQKEMIAKDAMKYNLDTVSISETHLKEDILEDITADKNGVKKNVYTILYEQNRNTHKERFSTTN